jgi:heme exporter protein B
VTGEPPVVAGPAQVLAVLRRELAVERAGRETLVTTVPFVAAFVVLAGLAFGPAPRQLASAAGGTLWLAVLVATVPLSRSVAGAEIAEDSWDLLRGLVRPGPLFAGKLLASWAGLLVTWLLAAGLVVFLFGVPLPPGALYGGLLGTLSLAALTTALGVLVAMGARRRGLLAALVLPGGLPALLAGTQLATPGVPALPWAALLTLYAAVVLTAAWAVFPVLLEE